MTINENDNYDRTERGIPEREESGTVAAAATKVRDTAADTLNSARTRAADAYETARERTSAAYDSVRETATSAGRRTADGIDANPIAALVGGLALGAIAAAFRPKTKREDQLFGQVGQRISDTARDAARAAKEAGREKLDEIGINAESAKQRVSELVGSSANAAVDTVRGQR